MEKKNNCNVVFIGDTPLLYSCVLTSIKFFKKIYLITKNKEINKKVPKEVLKVEDLNEVDLRKINFVFSIMNHKIISNTLINNKNVKFINFHDAFLPKYAGLYSSTWSILNNEKYHGVTWHEITNVVDGGNIYLQKKFKIKDIDNANSIDLKSNYYGIKTFSQLLTIIFKKNFLSNKQNIKKRTYYGLKDKLNIPNNGFLDFKDSLNKIIRLSKALKFSKNKVNKLCKLKLYTSEGVFEVEDVYLENNNKLNLFKTNDTININDNNFLIKKNNKIIRVYLKKKNLPKSFIIKTPSKKIMKKYINFNLD